MSLAAGVKNRKGHICNMTCDTFALSKKLAHHIGAIKYFICHYNHQLQHYLYNTTIPCAYHGYQDCPRVACYPDHGMTVGASAQDRTNISSPGDRWVVVYACGRHPGPGHRGESVRLFENSW